MARSRISILLVIILQFSSISWCQDIIINEVNQADGWLELYNASSTVTTDVTDWILYDFPEIDSISSTENVTILSGNPVMGPNTYLVINWDILSTVDGEVALFSSRDFLNPDALVDYMQYGNGHHRKAALATEKGIWDDPAAFVPNPTTASNSLVMSDQFANGPADTQSTDWVEGVSSLGANNNGGNAMPCPPLLLLNNNPITPMTYQAQAIISTGRIGNNASVETSFLAEDNVMLNDPFQVDQGGILVADIRDCP